MVGPHVPPIHVVVIGSSTHVLQAPVPALQPKVQVVSTPHWPVLPHVSVALPLHRTAPGTQTPPHAPLVGSQMNGHGVAAP
jgi:hypothetical protein